MASNIYNFRLVHVFVGMMVVALVVQESAAQSCISYRGACDTNKQSSCCSGVCWYGRARDGNNGTCGCNAFGPCATDADCCLGAFQVRIPLGLPPGVKLPVQVAKCEDSKCSIVEVK